MPSKEQLFKARMQTIIAVCDATLAYIGARAGEFNQSDIERVSKVRADAISRLMGDQDRLAA